MLIFCAICCRHSSIKFPFKWLNIRLLLKNSFVSHLSRVSSKNTQFMPPSSSDFMEFCQIIIWASENAKENMFMLKYMQNTYRNVWKIFLNECKYAISCFMIIRAWCLLKIWRQTICWNFLCRIMWLNIFN